MRAERRPEITVPDALAATLHRYFGAAGDAWARRLADLAAALVTRWQLRVDGEVKHGAVALIVPVRCDDGTPGVLKLQPVDEETIGEPDALRTWAGRGAVRLLRHDDATGAMLLERLDHTRSLASVSDDLEALGLLSELLARLSAFPAPAGLRRLDDIAASVLDRIGPRIVQLADPADRRLVTRCAGMVRELLAEPGDRLLHWDLHYDNVLAPLEPEDREPWLAIDPKPLAGDPGFELLPALHNRWDEVVATGEVSRAVRRRYDLMTEVLALERRRALGWTLGRVLQNVVWDLERGATVLDPVQRAVAHALLDRP